MDTTPLQKELQRLEADRLKAERQHQQRLNDLQTEIKLLEAKAPGLRELVTKLESEVIGNKNQRDSLGDVITGLFQKKTTLQEVITKKDTEFKQLQDQLDTISGEIIKQQGLVDSKLEQYTKNRRVELESTLTEKQQELQVVEDKLAEAHRTTLELSDRAKKQDAEFQQAQDIHKAVVEASSASQKGAEDRIRKLQADIESLQKQVKELSYQKATFESSIEKIRLEGKQFADYESKARKVLEAKDKELQEREQDVQIGEQHLQTRRSFLPKL